MKLLTDREVDIMLVIWESQKEEIPTGEILRGLPVRAKRNSLQTLQVGLRRLCEKECLTCRKGTQTNFYRATIDRDKYLRFAVDNFAEHHYHGSKRQLLFSLLDSGKFSAEDKRELLDFLEQCCRGESTQQTSV